jgi:hypothetical protein
VPDPPEGPLTEPKGPVKSIDVRAWTKAIWTFGTRTHHDYDSVTAVGPANLLFVPLKGNKTIFLVSVAAIITNGKGRFTNARGVKTALGVTLIDGSFENMFNLPPDKEFPAATIETFRIIKADDIGPDPRSSGQSGSGHAGHGHGR